MRKETQGLLDIYRHWYLCRQYQHQLLPRAPHRRARRQAPAPQRRAADVREALEEGQREEYYAIHALRFVLASFVKNPWRAPLDDIDYGDWYQYPGFYRGIGI